VGFGKRLSKRKGGGGGKTFLKFGKKDLGGEKNYSLRRGRTCLLGEKKGKGEIAFREGRGGGGSPSFLREEKKSLKEGMLGTRRECSFPKTPSRGGLRRKKEGGEHFSLWGKKGGEDSFN